MSTCPVYMHLTVKLSKMPPELQTGFQLSFAWHWLKVQKVILPEVTWMRLHFQYFYIFHLKLCNTRSLICSNIHCFMSSLAVNVHVFVVVFVDIGVTFIKTFIF